MWMTILRSRFAQAGTAILVFLGLLAVRDRRKRREVIDEIETEFEHDRTERLQDGLDKAETGRDSGLSPADRVRRNDGDWGGM